jgi:hypothetical protein
LRRSRSTLRLLLLLLAFSCRLLLLAFFHCCRSCCVAGLRALGAALFNYIKGGTDDTTLLLDRASCPLLGDFLCSKSTSAIVIL